MGAPWTPPVLGQPSQYVAMDWQINFLDWAQCSACGRAIRPREGALTFRHAVIGGMAIVLCLPCCERVGGKAVNYRASPFPGDVVYGGCGITLWP